MSRNIRALPLNITNIALSLAYDTLEWAISLDPNKLVPALICHLRLKLTFATTRNN